MYSKLETFYPEKNGETKYMDNLENKILQGFKVKTSKTEQSDDELIK